MTKRKPKTPALPPFPWETHVQHRGKPVRTARPDLIQADIVDSEVMDRDTGEVTTTSRRVWRTTLPPVLKIVNRARRMALVEYADAVERAGASGGTSDPTGGGGGGGGARSPSLTALVNAERLGRMNAALAGGELRLPLGGSGAVAHRRFARMTYRDLAHHAAVDGLGLSDILREMGVKPSESRRDLVMLALQEVAHMIARCCGYEGAQHAPNWTRNTSGAEL
ncbi:MAG: hypothetical protein AAGE03_04455 [Pseudomonadota bacterium]